MHTKFLKWLSYASCFVMFLATLGGSVVTKTESGLGCGNDWPLCHGKFVPAHTLASMIEYSHRAVSGAAGLFSLAAFIAFWMYRKNRKDLQLYSLMALIFVMVQAVMGAMAVIYPTSSAVMALHFGFSLIAFASSIMLVLGIREEERGQADRNAGRRSQDPVRPSGSGARVSKAFRNLTWFATAYTYIVVYLGAYVSHTDSAGGCSGWPLCNGQLLPGLSGGEGIAFIHRVAAALLLVVIATVGHFAYRKHPELPGIRKLGVAATVLVIIQVLTGATIALTINNYQIYLFASLAHIIVLASLFGVLCYLSVRAWQLSRTAKEVQAAPADKAV
ncbi:MULTISPECIES: COX15/CtaA family protein [Paenibacillus]|uniref:Cytochrome c oxidase assembly protein subunit 15 n=1 Tax=Paenibacillus barengoltzii J12 TaxID=935846 RepID=A0ABY1M2W9_9BACL|nr:MULTISPECIES: heme A synthase [Paenibacillus]MDU0329376.1 heme A synthase [Paenibacillus sp. 3LSP]MEC2343957.1 heme A synthase [Paenibacillus barengoltzii]SMF33007.1 cytochrome c oxidase assembly protein subunit 15 [Paenibacillus barengoltzii]SMF49392.1 cytochrome c oxidase assembly protein subunit 15 [Paenibacillus barengoltzii J12]